MLFRSDGAGRANWQFITALTAGNRMTYAPSNHVTTEFLYDWKDANGGSLTLRGYDGFPMFTTPFTRLD